jgi:hypothetical protein
MLAASSDAIAHAPKARPLLATICLLAGIALRPSPLAAQSGPDPSEGARYRFGTVAYTPGLILSTGHDSNVYREPTGFGDFEVFAVPQVEGWWTHPGFRVTALGAVEVVRFGHNVGALNNQAGIRIERTNSLFRPHLSVNRRHTNANPTGFEIGYKSLRLETDWSGGGTVRFSARTEFRAMGRLVRTKWDADARYLTSDLREKLNRDTYGGGIGVAYAVTPLTKVGANVEMARDRFRFSPVRDGETLHIASGIEFARPAVVSGQASFGYERFRSPASGAADFNGLLIGINVGYGSPDGTLVRFYMNRGAQYSFDTALAYYVMTSSSVTVARRVGLGWDLAAFAGRYGLDYRPPRLTSSADRVDVLTEVGGAVARRVGRWARVGWTAEHARKTGPGGFKAFRVVAFLTYGSGRFQRLDRPTPFER